jgi:hypothetical protein
MENGQLIESFGMPCYNTNLKDESDLDEYQPLDLLNQDAFCDSSLGKRHVGYKENNACIRKYFQPNTVRLISRKITELTMGVNPQNRPIIVPDKMICDLMDTIYINFRPETGGLYARYNIQTGHQRSLVQQMIDQVIEVAVTDIRNNIGIEECNKNLTKWTTVLGDFNNAGLRQHAPIRVSNRRPNRMEFHMNY